MNRLVATFLMLMALLPLVPASAAAATFSDIFVFGDSLSDPGNVYTVTGMSARPPYTVIPNAPYAIGAFHFSNGRTWIERLSARLGLPTGGKPAFSNPGMLIDHGLYL